MNRYGDPYNHSGWVRSGVANVFIRNRGQAAHALTGRHGAFAGA